MKRPRQSPPWFKGIVSVRWERSLPRLVILEKYERIVKWSLRLLTFAGIAASVLALPAWYISLALAVCLVAVQQFLQRVIFRYTTLYVQPLPDFELKPEEWVAMTYMCPPNPGPRGLNGVGLAFASEQYAADFFGLLISWNYGETEDTDDNVRLSLIVEDQADGAYSVYVYPNMQRPSIRQFHAEFEHRQSRQKPGKEHFPLVIQLVLHKLLPYDDTCHVNAFVEHQKPGTPFWLFACRLDEGGGATVLSAIQPILKHHLKFKKRADLDPTELEYHHGKHLMGK